jgi:hypothetical protein
MLHLLDESLETFLRTTVPLSKREIDVSFDAPDRDWAAHVSRPTVNLYLWDVRRNLDQLDSGEEIVRGEDGRTRRRPPLPRVDCRYLVTAWTSDVRDEHSVIGATLIALLRYREVEVQYLKGPFQSVRPIPTLEVAASDGRDNSDFWSALGGQLKPGLDLLVTATFDPSVFALAGPDVERLVTRIGELDTSTGVPEVRRTVDRVLVGGRSEEPSGTVVSTARGASRVSPSGTFLVPAETGDEVVVDGAVRGQVPDRGVIELTPEDD